ncbi:TPA: hypothetical protein P6M38_006467 [Pseudomonas aeruginosa]|uniref:hypothetical protein n=1 Tax=unclassified Pseudomonas TaxID=196821 RepID=UPI002156FA0D|nr:MULTISPECIES: hypothetical protein [unclassified Pseudomonas]HBP0910563.1 hypothetical protein [Pseudomonas aeruginosa]HBP1706865.1 hypothetical protein [Pseudomonas aeruginosa]HDP3522998.1 hypothetical protein [Pseudomonas aeruginosa]
MKQLKQLFSLGKREAVIGGSLLMASGLSMAAEGDIDTTKALAYIAGGLAAAAAVTGAMFGLVALIGASKKAMRAGT